MIKFVQRGGYLKMQMRILAAVACALFTTVVAAETVVVSNDVPFARSGNGPSAVWIATYEHPFTIIGVGDISVPIQTGPLSVSLANSDQGRITITREGVGSATRTPLVEYTHGATVFRHRPTLFVSICGFSQKFTNSGAGVCPWQEDLETKLRNELSDHQYKHFRVDWDTHLPNITQVRMLGKVIGDFLNQKNAAWDVVIIGHSRGGIFAHELTREIVGHPKIKRLHTYLLDPTACGTPLLDVFPVGKHDASPTLHYGNNFYDGQYLVYGSNIGTTGDRDIPGYANQLFPNDTHETFVGNWLSARFSSELSAINTMKSDADAGLSFPVDGTSGMDYVKVTHSRSVNFNGTVSFSSGNASVLGWITFPGTPASVFLDATIGADGVQIVGATGTGISQLVLDSDRAYISSSTEVGTFISSLSGNGLAVTVQDMLLFNASANVSSSGTVYTTLSIGGNTIPPPLGLKSLVPGLSW